MAASVWRNAVDTANKNSPHSPLPNGLCNFRQLSSGSKAPTCGCRRFWLDKPVTVHDGSSPEERAMCCCGHHACFHDIQANDVTPSARRSHHIPTSTIARNDTFAALNDNRDVGLLTCPQLRQTIHVSNPTRDHDFAQPRREGVMAAPNNIWGGLNAFARWQDPSWIPSTAPPSVLSHDQKDGSLSGSQKQPKERPTSPERPYMPLFPAMQDIVVSPTVEGSIRESVRGSLQTEPISEVQPTERKPLLADDPPRQFTDASAPTSKMDISEKSPESPSNISSKIPEIPITSSKAASLTQDWQNLIQTCMQRLGDLENISFSHVPVEEIQDKFEILDGRLLDLEYWKADLEARLKASDMLVDDRNSSASSISSRTNNETFFSRVADIEQRLEELEGAQPSYACPWEVEVVLLPFGRKLNGIWYDSTDNAETKRSVPRSDEWNGVDKPAASLLASAKTERTAWTSDSIQAWADTVHPWFWPKAPGPNNKVFKRLRSRGLVRTISLTETGAHGIWATLRETFSDFVDGQPDHTSNPRQQPYQALDQPLIPLRKIRKSSWLHFLSPHELITPSTWDLAFLNSGVFMHAKGGVKRLYLTTADAYTQSYNNGWTWQRIRELPLPSRSTKPDVVVSKEDHYEPCWDYTAALDDVPSFDSFNSIYSAPESPRGRSPTRHEPSSPRSQSSFSSTSTIILRRPSSSFPVITRKISSQAKRRTSPSCTPIAYQKRRRVSSSPGFCGGPIELTPRWSHEPPTPSLTDNLWETRSAVLASGSRKRGSTPFAYATPHSHGFKNLHLTMADGGGDTEVEDEGEAEASEKEWEGVEENDDAEQGMFTARSSFGDQRGGEAGQRRSFGSAGSSGVEFGAEDDDPDGDGWTIYEA